MNINIPNNIQIETSLISHAIIVGAGEMVESLCPDDFFNGKLRELFLRICKQHAAGEPIDVSALAGHGVTASELSRIMDHPIAMSVEASCKKLKDLTAIRRLIFAANETMQRCQEFNGDGADRLINDAQTSIMAIEPAVSGDTACRFGLSCEQTIERIEQLQKNKALMTGVTSGYPGIDKITGGFQRSDLIILAARPGMGKTALAVNISQNSALSGSPVAFFSLEMSQHQLNCRVLARAARINGNDIRNCRITNPQWDRMTLAASKLYNIPLYIDDTPGLHYMEIRRRARRLKRDRGISLVVVDYIQLARGDNPQFREREVASISAGLKNMAKELDLPVIALAQLNRKLDDNANKRPALSHLRESGALEQDADIVIFIHRDDYYNQDDNNPKRGLAEVIFAKHRNGPTGFSVLTWIPEQSAFENFSGEYQP